MNLIKPKLKIKVSCFDKVSLNKIKILESTPMKPFVPMPKASGPVPGVSSTSIPHCGISSSSFSSSQGRKVAVKPPDLALQTPYFQLLK